MIIEIDGLKMPPSSSSVAELFNNDTQKRTVRNRLITKIGTQKWRLTQLYDKDTLSLEFQTKFYEKCALLRNSAKTITFISPYDGQQKRIMAKLVSLNTPQILKMNKVPKLYNQIGAVFEEV